MARAQIINVAGVGAGVRRERVVYVARGGAIDGASRQLLYLLAHLDRARITPLVLLDKSGPTATGLDELNVAVEVTPMRPWRSVRGWPFRHRDLAAMQAIVGAFQPTLIHCSDPWRAAYASRLARRQRVPFVVHVRGPMTSRDLQKNDCLRADVLIGIADRYRDDIAMAGVEASRIRICDDAVDTDHYARDPSGGAAFRARHGRGRRFVVGLVGRIEPFKKTVEFVDVASRVSASLDVTFVCIGATARCDYVRDVQRTIEDRSMQDRVVLTGRIDDMPAVLSGLDLLVTLSGGSVMFEAQACGVAVLSARGDGRHSRHTRHGETGWCVSSDQSQAIAAAIELLLRDDHLRGRLARAGRDHVVNELSPARMAERTMAAYDVAFARCAAS